MQKWLVVLLGHGMESRVAIWKHPDGTRFDEQPGAQIDVESACRYQGIDVIPCREGRNLTDKFCQTNAW
jgi:hypothetical protein